MFCYRYVTIKVQNKVQKHDSLHKKEMKNFCSQYGIEELEEPSSSRRKKRIYKEQPRQEVRYYRRQPQREYIPHY